ncbi:MAG: cytochrome c oxidase subunit II [Bacteroidia bacterium]
MYFPLQMFIYFQSIFNSFSPQSEKIRSITNGFIIAACFILLLVIFLTIYILVKFRAKTNKHEPKEITSNRKLEILMVTGPFILVLFFFFWSIKIMNAVLPERHKETPDVVITGHQWWWEISYPSSKSITSNELHLPVGKKLLLQLNSADVIHSWWVPSLAGKMDMIPGTTNYLWMTLSKPGIYEGACSEFCGQQHAWMRIRVIGESPEDFNQWVIINARNALPILDSKALAGETLFKKATCSSCHSIRGTDAKGIAGPDLTHFASRKMILGGILENNPKNVFDWLTDPQKIKPGAHMPRFIFNRDSISALTAYLEQLK